MVTLAQGDILGSLEMCWIFSAWEATLLPRSLLSPIAGMGEEGRFGSNIQGYKHLGSFTKSSPQSCDLKDGAVTLHCFAPSGTFS